MTKVSSNRQTEDSVVHDLRNQLRDCLSDKSKMAGSISAISKYLTSVGITSEGSVQQRVKLLTLLYEEALSKNKRLSLLLDMKGSDSEEL